MLSVNAPRQVDLRMRQVDLLGKARAISDNRGAGKLGQERAMIHDKLALLRRRSGMSQQEVAATIGVTRQTVSNWELGQGSPALDKAAELARLYGVTLDDLVSDEVDVVSMGAHDAPRDLHVLRGLMGRAATLELVDGVQQDVELLDVSSAWLRVSCTVKRARLGSPRVESERVIRLIDLNDVCSIAIEGRPAGGSRAPHGPTREA